MIKLHIPYKGTDLVSVGAKARFRRDVRHWLNSNVGQANYTAKTYDAYPNDFAPSLAAHAGYLKGVEIAFKEASHAMLFKLTFAIGRQ